MTPAPWTARDACITAPPRRRDVDVHELGDEAILTLPGDGCTYHLNQTARVVWERCDGATTTREMATMLACDYEVAFDEALNDVEELIAWLAEASLLREPCDR
jgi:hypothetical protein